MQFLRKLSSNGPNPDRGRVAFPIQLLKDLSERKLVSMEKAPKFVDLAVQQPLQDSDSSSLVPGVYGGVVADHGLQGVDAVVVLQHAVEHRGVSSARTGVENLVCQVFASQRACNVNIKFIKPLNRKKNCFWGEGGEFMSVFRIRIRVFKNDYYDYDDYDDYDYW